MTFEVGSNPFPWLNGKVMAKVAYKVEDDEIHLETTLASHVTREVARLKDKAVREALIKAGWTPPEAKEMPGGTE